MAYYSFLDDDGRPYGSFETFYCAGPMTFSHEPYDMLSWGWYWQACFPGCLPDGDAVGPFETEEAAILDARSA